MVCREVIKDYNFSFHLVDFIDSCSSLCLRIGFVKCW